MGRRDYSCSMRLASIWPVQSAHLTHNLARVHRTDVRITEEYAIETTWRNPRITRFYAVQEPVVYVYDASPHFSLLTSLLTQATCQAHPCLCANDYKTHRQLRPCVQRKAKCHASRADR